MIFKFKKTYKRDKGIPLIISIILVFCILGAIVFSVAQKISEKMSLSAINNLSESLEMIKGTLEAILLKESEFQKLIAQEITIIDNPEDFISSYNENETMIKLSLVLSGETTGISNTGELFLEESLNTRIQ